VAVSAGALEQAFAAIAGPDGVRAGPDTAPVDGAIPRWVVAPRSVEELGRVVALASDERLGVVPRGSGSTLALGHPVSRADVVVDLGRLHQIVEYHPDDLTVTVQAGVSLAALAARLAPRGQWLPLDPPAGSGRTLGGLAATGASGPLRARYGTLRDLLLGVRFAQADGVLTWGGAKVVKSVTGYDVPKLMVSALGTLGILAELTLRLHPRPAVERTWLATFGDAAAAQAFVAALVDSPLQPNRVEWLNAAAGRAWGVSAATALAVSVGSVEAAVLAQGARLEALTHAAGGDWRGADPRAWLGHGAGDAARPPAIALRVTTRASHLAATARGIESALARVAPAATVAVSGCAPLGVLRALVDGATPAEGAALVSRLREAVAPVDGAVVVERAPAALRTAVDPWGPVPAAALDLMVAIKRQFDPRGILNAGRFVGGL
jgi:glycolate oxidase FAD binding subunit